MLRVGMIEYVKPKPKKFIHRCVLNFQQTKKLKQTLLNVQTLSTIRLRISRTVPAVLNRS